VRTACGSGQPSRRRELAEMFKIEKGKIRRIEAILESYGMGSGWSRWGDQMSDRARYSELGIRN